MERHYDFKTIEHKWRKIWQDRRVFKTEDKSDKPKYYALEMFPYPSGSGLHVGHLRNYIPMDAFCRYKRMNGFNVLHPMGWDAFGQPAENEAIRRGRNPRDMVPEYAASYKRTLTLVGASYDWDREINSSLPEYYKWTQWFFLLLYKRGLAYRSTSPINWCPVCKTGLANEEVKEGRCWRCDAVVEKRQMPQWFFKITAYADKLLNDLDTINWSSGLKEMQRDWIGRSEGMELNFPVKGRAESIKVFTTRADTIFGATFLVLSPEHPLSAALTTPERKTEVAEYIRASQRLTEIERMSAERTKTGVFTGSYAVNPATGSPIPVWIADYVLMDYGSGAIMAVPAHDQRDFDFAKKFTLPVVMVYQRQDGPKAGGEMSCALPDGGIVVNSGKFNGLPNSAETITEFAKWLEGGGHGKRTVNYRLRDWLISRQRYWGAPIPIIHCPKCGEVPVPDDQLPVLLPEVDNYQPSGTGESPLAAIPQFVDTSCPKCSGPARRETDTMGGYACSSWYFLRYVDPHNNEAFAGRDKLDYWLPVDLYSGGVEHARSHLLYARFWCKVMHDAGLINFTEPFRILRNQGSMLALTPGRKPRKEDSGPIDWILLKHDELNSVPKDQIVWRWARMSKSKGNTVSPDDVIEKHGADSLRLYEMFVAPFDEDVQWSEEGISGSFRFVSRAWRWAQHAADSFAPDWREKLAAAKLNPEEQKIRRKVHQTIAKVDADLEAFRFNTAIAALMTLLNDLYLYHSPVAGESAGGGENRAPLLSEALETIILLFSPFAPHMADELWEQIGRPGLACDAQWPESDAALAAESELIIPVQVNGKLRARVTVPAAIDDQKLEAEAVASKNVVETLKGKKIRKVIIVQRKLVNIVASDA